MKKLLTILLALCLVGGLTPSLAFATETSWTEVSDGNTLISKLNEGGNIKLVGEASEISINVSDHGSPDGGIQINKIVNLDLNGKKLSINTPSGDNKNKGIFINIDSGSLTVSDSSTSESGKFSTNCQIEIKNGGTLTMNSGTIEGDEPVSIGTGCTFTMNGGRLNKTVSNVSSFYLNGGEIDTGSKQAIDIRNNGIMYANGGWVSSTAQNAVIFGGAAGTSHGTITCDGTKETIFDCDVMIYLGVIEGGIYNGKVKIADGYVAAHGYGLAKITGGTFNGKVECCDTISGGTFNGAITEKAYSAIYTSNITLGTSATITTASGCNTVTYFTDGKEYVQQAVESNKTTSAPTIVPKKIGYTFGGWYKDGTSFNFTDTTVTSNLSVYATWNECTGHTYDANNICTKCGYKKVTYSGGGGGGSSYTATQKPTVAETENGKVTLSADGRTATITPDEGYEVAKVMVNSQEKGTVTTLTGLKTGDKVEVTFQKSRAALAPAVSAVAKTAVTGLDTMKARSSKTANGNVKVVVSLSDDESAAISALADLGYTVKYKFYRSTKKASGYKAMIEKNSATYTNTTGKAGTRYYYKCQIRVYDQTGTLVAKTELKNCKYACRKF